MNKYTEKIKIRKDNSTLITEFVLDDEFNDDMVKIEVKIMDVKYSAIKYDFFTALQELRRNLEKDRIYVLCNGAALNVYPSPMQLSMGTGTKAYVNYISKPAKMDDVVNIFDCDSTLEFVSVKEQDEFHKQWLNSIRRI